MSAKIGDADESYELIRACPIREYARLARDFSPRSLMSPVEIRYKLELGWMRVLRSVIFPSCQIKAREEANPAVKEVPIIWPWSLIPVASLMESPSSVPRSIFCHLSARGTRGNSRSRGHY